MNEEVRELELVAEAVVREELSSRVFPYFVAGLQEDRGHEPGAAVRRIALEVKRSGQYWTPGDIARRLRDEAERLKAQNV